jgi:hypothetical protein
VKAYQVVGERIDGGVDILEESDDQKQAWLDFAWHSKEEMGKLYSLSYLGLEVK